MGTTYLLDTNTVIYFLDSLLTEKSLDFIEKCLDNQAVAISVISKIELLGWREGSPKQLQNVTDFIQEIEVLALTDAIVGGTIEIRRSQKIKLPDAVIAATAIVHDLTLISRNDYDFRKVPELKYLNPFTDI